MNRFVVVGKSAIHEGHTKYYQVIEIKETETRRGIVITHYGALSLGIEMKPKYHGTRNIALHERGVDSAFNTAIAKKRKRDYLNWKDTLEEPNLDLGEMLSLMRKWLVESDVKKIMEYFDLSLGDVVEEDLFEDAEPVRATAPIERPVEWGSW